MSSTRVQSPILAILAWFALVLAMQACALQAPPQGPASEEGEEAANEGLDALDAVTYSEMRLTPRGVSSGLERDLEPMREESASDKIFFEGSPLNIDLARRARLRAFEGAPPVIPHFVEQNSAPECLACHGARLQFRGRAARPICHDEHTNCTACHVMSSGPAPSRGDLGPDPRAVGNSFVGMRHQVQGAVVTLEPPRIAHRTAMRERCAACHGQNGPGAGHHPVDFELKREVPKSFTLSADGRLTCRTCHQASEQLPSFGGAAAAVPNPIPAGSDLCFACHDSAHEPVFARLGLSGGAHPGGASLDKILSERMRADTTRSGCLGCHGTHGALEKGVLRDAGEGRVCAVCHRGEASVGNNHPVGGAPLSNRPLPSDLPVGEGGSPICRSCHDLAAGTGNDLLRKMQGGGSMCMACHDDRQAAMKSKHGKAGEGLREPCFGCHEVHGVDQKRHLLATASRATGGDPMGCLACHGPGGRAAKADVRPAQQGHPVDGRRHAGLDKPLTCVACHDAHEPDPSKIVCGSCHKDKADAFSRGGHGTAECLDCHPAHGDYPTAPIAGLNPAAQRCLACHDEKLGKAGVTRVAEYTHPVPVFTLGGERWEPLGALPLYGSNGKPVASGANGDLTCSTCHTTHGPDATHLSDHLRRPGWQGVCSACHGDASLLVYRYFHDREKLGETPQ